MVIQQELNQFSSDALISLCKECSVPYEVSHLKFANKTKFLTHSDTNTIKKSNNVL